MTLHYQIRWTCPSLGNEDLITFLQMTDVEPWDEETETGHTGCQLMDCMAQTLAYVLAQERGIMIDNEDIVIKMAMKVHLLTEEELETDFQTIKSDTK